MDPADITPPRSLRRFQVVFVGVAVALVFAGVVALLWITNNDKNIRQIQNLQHEGLVIRSDICRSFEQTHRREVTQLKSTYKYLLSLSPEERKTTLNRTVASQLPQAERDARSDQDDLGVFVPRYCDRPKSGLPEPDPVVPKRPKQLHP